MKELSIDIETRSAVDIKKAGAYRYALDPSFRILLFAYKVDDLPTQIVDLAQGEELPVGIRVALADQTVIKHAYNAAFEWFCLTTAGYMTALGQWRCTMAHGSYCGYPAGLDALGQAIGLPPEQQKLKTGRALIKHFCTPSGSKLFEWNEPEQSPEKWELFKEYCKQDVETEYAIRKRLEPYAVPESEWYQWRLCTAMNAFGVMIEPRLAQGAAAIDEAVKAQLLEEAKAVTGLDNPGSNQQMLKWLHTQGVEAQSLDKEAVADLLAGELPADVRSALEIRQQSGKTSTAKYTTMLEALCPDGRVRGLTQFYGARTGRYSGRLVQMQNLPRNHCETLDIARELAMRGDGDSLRLLYGDVPDILSQLIRTAFTASPGKRLVVSDFSAIEARVIAWLAGEEWVNEVFRTHGKIYEATAAQMFGVPIEKIKKGNPEYDLRQKGKVATLALGYQGGPNALIAMGALKQGIPEGDLPEIVERWRHANPNIVRLWYELENAALGAMRDGEAVADGLLFRLEGDAFRHYLTIELPSGRKIFYVDPSVEPGRKETLNFWAASGTSGKWSKQSTYGGKLAENVVQAIARDCLAVTLARLDEKHWPVLFHVHDEVIIDAPPECSVEAVTALMGEPISWAPGLVLKAAGFESEYYMKD